ncbi:MAG TPA: family 43 glycosylhydrolase [Lacunisphaera sp.]|nr:family 43 glycosylhydrolase [Lacunisphaera sp.]
MSKRCLLSIACLATAGLAAATGAEIGSTRLINPLPLPDYPIGRLVRTLKPGQPHASAGLWLSETTGQYRELADPSALWHEGKWYLYPSVDMAWVSADEGRSWQHHPLNVRDIGYAPTVVHHRGRFLLLASGSDIHAGPTPLGPFESIGKLVMPAIKGLPGQVDPMLFSDDGRLFYYWGCTPNSGIWGVELDPENPTRLRGEPRELVPFRPDTYAFERVGSSNQNPNNGWMEGAWMVKANGRYFLTYSAGGTQYRTYTMGAYVADSPLGPFTPQQRNPFFRTTDGLVTGTAHGCIVRGPRDRFWAFYTVFAGATHGFERRLGLDLVEFDARGELHIPGATSAPQALPGEGDAEPWLALNESEPNFGSSSAPNAPGRFAGDNSLTTWWLPADDDPTPTLTAHFSGKATIHAARVAWHDVDLDTTSGKNPGAFRYRIEAETSPLVWTTIIDRGESTADFLIDYRECAPVSATRARLVIVGHPPGIRPGVAEFTVFGVTERVGN